MSEPSAGAVPDDVIEEVAKAIFGGDWDHLLECGRESYRESASDALAVPAVVEWRRKADLYEQLASTLASIYVRIPDEAWTR